MKKLIVLVCVFAVALTAAIVVGCGGDTSGAKNASKQFLTATKNKNVDALWNTITKANQAKLNKEQMRKDAQAETGTSTFTWTFGKVTVKGNQATVEATLKEGKNSLPLTIQLVKENGKWKVDFEKSFGGT